MSNSINKPTYAYKRFRVKRSDGVSTTVSVSPALVVQACRVLGSLATVGRLVREAARTYDRATSTAKNRSDHASRALEACIKEKQREALSGPPRAIAA